MEKYCPICFANEKDGCQEWCPNKQSDFMSIFQDIFNKDKNKNEDEGEDTSI